MYAPLSCVSGLCAYLPFTTLMAELVSMAEGNQNAAKRSRTSSPSPPRLFSVRSKRQKKPYKANDRVKAKWPQSVNDRLWPGTIVKDTDDQCLIKFDHGGEVLFVQNINVHPLLPSEEKVGILLDSVACLHL